MVITGKGMLTAAGWMGLLASLLGASGIPGPDAAHVLLAFGTIVALALTRSASTDPARFRATARRPSP